MPILSLWISFNLSTISGLSSMPRKNGINSDDDDIE